MPIHDWTRVSAGTFHDFHTTWLVELKRVLNDGVLPPDFYALAEQFAGGLGPDVLTLDAAPPGPNGAGASDPSSGGGVAVRVAPPKVRFTDFVELGHYTRKRKTIVIRHSSGDRVVAMVEILSPGNKASRHALRAFVAKAEEVLRAGVHLLLVDLFPPGPRDPQGIHAAFWSEITDHNFVLPPDKPLTLAAYAAGDVLTAYVEPVAVGDALPDMPLFLTPDEYVPTPLESAYRRAWDAVPRRWRAVLEGRQTAS